MWFIAGCTLHTIPFRHDGSILEPFTAEVKRVVLSAPKVAIRFQRNRRMDYTRAGDQPKYWAKHFREAVHSLAAYEIPPSARTDLAGGRTGECAGDPCEAAHAKLATRLLCSSCTDGTANCREEPRLSSGSRCVTHGRRITPKGGVSPVSLLPHIPLIRQEIGAGRNS